MSVPKQAPQRPRPKESKCEKSSAGQHRFMGFPHTTAKCIFCGKTRKEAENGKDTI